MYGVRTKTKRSVYGPRKPAPCVCVPEIPPVVGLTLLRTILYSLKDSISIFFPSVSNAFPMTGKMNVSGLIPARVFVRLMWIKRNETPDKPADQFDPTNSFHLWQLKDIYQSIRVDWKTDPIADLLATV